MRTPVAPTYLVPTGDCVEASAWTDEGGAVIGESVDHWDPATELRFTRAVTVDLDAVREQCRLGPDAAFALIATWRAPTRTRLGDVGDLVELGNLGGLVRAPVTVTIPGRESGGRLDLTTRLVMRSAGTDASPISPRRPGTVLWTETDRVALEGSAARFPMAATDFTVLARVPDGAAWFIEWDPQDLEAPVLGGLRLLLNSEHPRIVSAVRTASDDPAAPIVRSMIECDVARHLVRTALDNETFLRTAEGFPDESVGRLLIDLVAMVWPGIPLPALRARALQDPARIDAEVQAALGVAT